MSSGYYQAFIMGAYFFLCTFLSTLCVVTGAQTVPRTHNEGAYYAEERGQSNCSSTGWYDVLQFGAVGDDKTDNTAAFAACMNTLLDCGGGTMFIPNGVYRGQIVIPALQSSGWVTVRILGQTPPTPVFGTVGKETLPAHGTIVKSLAQTGTAVISVTPYATTADDDAGTTINKTTITTTRLRMASLHTVTRARDHAGVPLSGSFSSVYVILKNLDVRTYDNPMISGIDLQYALQCRLDHVFINTDVYNVLASEPKHSNAVGLRTPAINNAALTVLRDVYVTGYYSCLDVNEHTDGGAVVLGSCINCMLMETAYHASFFARVEAFHCVNTITVNGKHAFSIGELDIEHTGPGQNSTWQDTVADVNDPGNMAVASLHYWVVEGNVGWSDTFSIKGGATCTRPADWWDSTLSQHSADGTCFWWFALKLCESPSVSVLFLRLWKPESTLGLQ